MNLKRTTSASSKKVKLTCRGALRPNSRPWPHCGREASRGKLAETRCKRTWRSKTDDMQLEDHRIHNQARAYREQLAVRGESPVLKGHGLSRAVKLATSTGL